MSGARQIQPVFTLLNKARDRVGKIKHKIMVLSGKGGVGKSFISSMLALALAEKGYRVSILDADIHGSSIPTILGLHGMRHFADEEGILPVEGPLGVQVVAINLMLDFPDAPVVWRGPLKSRAITELLAKVKWPEGDFLVIDLPPGTGDEAITVVQTIRDLSGAVIVTAPNMLSEVIVSKAINFVVKNNVKLLGIVENMSYFKCPGSDVEYNLLGRSTGEELAKKYQTKLLARIPLDPLIGRALEEGVPYLLAYREGEAAKAIRSLAEEILRIVQP
ncbi:Mrp/NBP35 family ATP-binding protein [Thermogladius sp. KZ2Tp1]|uniref:Mrp/NBP35 family ATP-binding protein n=1 Tax=Thermogladius sp. KZ2Tp1 TaxID=3136289 RepID=UPI003DAA336A